MSDGNERRRTRGFILASHHLLESCGSPSGSETNADARRTDHAYGHHNIADLKPRLRTNSSSPPHLREQIWRHCRAPEDRDVLFREIRKGGMSFDQFNGILGLEVHPQPVKPSQAGESHHTESSTRTVSNGIKDLLARARRDPPPPPPRVSRIAQPFAHPHSLGWIPLDFGDPLRILVHHLESKYTHRCGSRRW